MSTEKKNFLFDEPLPNFDEEANKFLRAENRRQHSHVILIASESVSPKPVRQVLSHVFTNIYAEGYPSTRMSVWERDNITDIERHLAFFRRYADRRYYKGTEFADFIETLAQKRAAEMFTQYNENGVKPEEVFVNVQPLSGAAANNAVYNAFVKSGETVMGIELSHGGHLSHGSPVNRSGMFHNIVHYNVDPKTGQLDYDEIYDLAVKHKPKLIIGGASAFPWAMDWKAMRKAADACGAILMADVAHPAGLIVAGLYPNPVGIADVITTTTHKTLCGPRGAIILCTNPEYAAKLDLGVFPGEQGGPHINAIAAKAVAFGLALKPEFKELQTKIRDNAALMAEHFTKRGFKIAYGGTNSHLFLLDLKKMPGVKKPYNADIASRVLDLVNITANKNTVAGDLSAANPSGLRIGTTWISQLGFEPQDCIELADIIADTLQATVPFDVLGAFGDLGRGKLPIEALISARSRIEKLLKAHPWEEVAKTQAEDEYYLYGSDMPYPLCAAAGGDKWPEVFTDAEKESALLEDVAMTALDDEALIEIEGERAKYMLDQLTTADIQTLKVGDYAPAFFLENSGRILADAWIFRMEAKLNENERYLVRTSKDNKHKLLTWLQAHDDGYILFEEEDLYSKIDGPVALKDLRVRSKNRKFCFAFMGKNADQAVSKLFPEQSAIKNAAEFKIDEVCYKVLKYTLNEIPVVEIYVGWVQTPIFAGKVKETLTDKIFAGTSLYYKLRGKAGLSCPYISVSCQENPIEKFPERFKNNKPYFVGQRVTSEKIETKPVGTEFKWEEKESPLKYSCLHAEHLKLKGRMVPFAGWEMPVMYTSIADEHKKVRQHAGLFDVSHMGVFEFEGPDAEAYLDLVTSNFVKRLRPGNSHYSYIFDANADVIDDIMVYRSGKDKFQMVVNAANEDKDWDWFNGVLEGRYFIDKDNSWKRIPHNLVIRNMKTDKSLGDKMKIDIALQGRNSMPILQAMIKSAETRQKLAWMAKTDFMEVDLAGIPAVVAKTGYTGEPVGFELYLHPEQAPELWNKILSFADTFPVFPVGLGARDSTRTEAGFPLYGHELAGNYNIFPTEAGYGSFVKRHKPFFIGRKLFLGKEDKQINEIVRFKVDKKGISTIHPGAPVLNKKGQCIGYVTSATLVGSKQMGLALIVKRNAKVGNPISIVIPPRKGATAVNPVELKPGEKMILPESAKIIERFPEECELLANLTNLED